MMAVIGSAVGCVLFVGLVGAACVAGTFLFLRNNKSSAARLNSAVSVLSGTKK
jgi:hypothetical protein